MNYRIVNGAISYGAETILEEINFEIKEKEKIAIVGRNGAGKTSLLKAIINNEMLEAGIGEEKFGIYKQGSPQIGYLKQIAFEDTSKTMLEEILKVYEPIIKLEEKISKLEAKLQEESNDELIKNYTESLDRYEFEGGYTYKKEYETAIKKFGFSKQDEGKKIEEFSGGQRTKIAFLKLLLSKPDILLLDEPTNHLDITAIEWLEKYLKNYPKAVVIVSHDRMFLDRIVDKVYEIEYGTITEYKGNYTSFENQKRINYEKQLKDYEYQQAEIKRLQAIADRFRYKPTKAKMALSKLKKIEQMTIIEEPNKYDLKNFHSNFNIEQESGKMVVTAKELQIGYDKPIANISFSLYRGQKLAIIGENGIGKSTLLKTLENIIPKQNGELEFGHNVKIGYFDQQMKFKDEEKTVFDEISEAFPELTTTQIRTLLGTFLFTGEDVFKKIKVLSGGEKSRLQLCKIFKKGPNLLLLDEPTNHMDIIGKESLENILKEYKGTLIFVSHDRYFVNKIADCILEFEKVADEISQDDKNRKEKIKYEKIKVTFFNGNYEEYERKKYEEDSQEKQENLKSENKYKNENIVMSQKYKKIDIGDNQLNNISKNANKSQENIINKNTNKNQYLINKEKNKLKNKIEKIEKEIEEKENNIDLIKEKMTDKNISTDYIKLSELEEEIKQIEDEINKKMEQWEELSNKYSELDT